MPTTTFFQVLLIEDREDRCDRWMAQCLQYDISASANTLKDVLYEFERAIIGHQAVAEQLGVEPFKAMPAAPRRFWDLWETAKQMELEDNAAFRVSHGLSIPPPTRHLRIAACA